MGFANIEHSILTRLGNLGNAQTYGIKLSQSMYLVDATTTTNQPTNYTNMIIVHLQLWRPDHRTTSAYFNLDEIKQDIY